MEACRGSSNSNKEYCQKDGDFEEFGEFPGNQGRRTDIQEFLEWADTFVTQHSRAPTRSEVAVAHPEMFLRFSRNLMELLQLRAPPPAIRNGSPAPWQQDLETRLLGNADDRTVLFYIDREGNKGKSWFQGYFFTKHPEVTQCLGVGKRDDIAFAIDENKRIFFFNVPRGAMQFVQYTIFEQLKDKMLFSTKYQSTTKILRQYPHVVVFCNEGPDMEAMSTDRYEIVDMSDLPADSLLPPPPRRASAILDMETNDGAGIPELDGPDVAVHGGLFAGN